MYFVSRSFANFPICQKWCVSRRRGRKTETEWYKSHKFCSVWCMILCLKLITHVYDQFALVDLHTSLSISWRALTAMITFCMKKMLHSWKNLVACRNVYRKVYHILDVYQFQHLCTLYNFYCQFFILYFYYSSFPFEHHMLQLVLLAFNGLFGKRPGMTEPEPMDIDTILPKRKQSCLYCASREVLVVQEELWSVILAHFSWGEVTNFNDIEAKRSI